ncbi:ras-related protein Rab-36-like [Dendronephthya gigantea]|uniref:ras-related protein Rab-36-like n=1 Tax=Dendronephthya gigantea TaxID=151771 RepID=UPI00106A0863|nr:ras-related protein Rab-36-like [Dendronephthya gigantea]
MSKERTNKDNRIVMKYPQPYNQETAVRKQTNFSFKTREAAESGEFGEEFGMKICKTIVIGDVAVGKTSLVNRYCKNIFETDYKATIGVDFQMEIYNMLGLPFSMQMWDTAGQERFKCIASAYYRGAHVIVTVFDLSEIKSLEGARRWLNEAIAENSSHSPDIFLVGSKKDLLKPSDLEKMEEYAVDFAKEFNAEYWSVSAKTGENVDLLFIRTAALAFDQAVLRECEDMRNIGGTQQIGNAVIKLNNAPASKEASKKKGCC